MSSNSADGGEAHTAKRQLTRRTMMIGTAGAIAGAGSIGMVSAANSAIDWSASLAPNARIEGAEVEIAEIGASKTDLEFVDNDGNNRSLAEWGGILRPEAPSGVEDDPNNPVSVRADKIDAPTYRDYPRDVTDSNDEPISALDAANWTSSGLTVADAGDGLQLDATTAGDSATLDLSAIDGVLDSGIERRVLQTVANVSSVATGIEVTVSDGTNSVVETIAGATGNGIVSQTQLGSLTGSGNLAQISSLTITAVGGAASVELVGLDIQREAKLSFGTREITETNDNGDQVLAEEDVLEPSGYYSIKSMETIGSQLSERTTDVRFNIESTIEELASDKITVEFSDAPASRSASRQMDLAAEFELPSAFDLSWLSTGSLADTGSFPSGNYRSVELLEDAELSSIDDPFALGDSASSVGGEYDLDTEVDLSTASGITPAPGVGSLLHYSVLLSSDQESMLSASDGSFFGGAGGTSGDGGLLGSFRGFIMMIAGVGGAVIAWLRARGRSLTGGS